MACQPFVRRGVQVAPQTRDGWIATARFVASLLFIQAVLLGIILAAPRYSAIAAAAFVSITLMGSALFYRWSWKRADVVRK